MPASMKHVISVPWTDEERTALRQLWENGIGCTGIGRHLGRSKYSVRSEIETLNLGPRGRPRGRCRQTPPGRVVLEPRSRSPCRPTPARCRRYRARCMLMSETLKLMLVDDVLDMPLDSVEMSARLRNTLSNDDMKTLRDVMQHTERELMRIPNFGIVSLRDLVQTLAHYGLVLPPDVTVLPSLLERPGW